jgi:TRAP-type uncharacterized transport system fused permease subunit
MGAAIFIMADILGMPFSELLVMATVPIILFYVPLAFSGHLIAKREGVEATLEESIELKDLVINGGPFFVPLGILVYLLVIAESGVMLSGAYAIAIAILVSGIAYFVSELSISKIMDFFTDVIRGAEIGMYTVGKLTLLGASVGIILRVLTVTALSQQLGLLLLETAGNSLFLLLILAMLLSILLGMGSPPVVAYLITALLIAPQMIEFGVPSVQAHFFVFYSSILSYITPPVALNVAVAASIAETKFIATSISALRLGIPLFIIPFTFVYFDVIPTEGIGIATMVTVSLLTVAFCSLSYLLYSGANRVRKLVAIGVGVCSLAVLIIVENSLGSF